MQDYPFYSQEAIAAGQKIVPVKLFALWSWATWYLTEYDSVSGEAFGYVEWLTNDPSCDEWGYFNINELQSLRRFGIPLVEMDTYFQPKKFSKIRLRGL